MEPLGLLGHRFGGPRPKGLFLFVVVRTVGSRENLTRSSPSLCVPNGFRPAEFLLPWLMKGVRSLTKFLGLTVQARGHEL